MSTKKKVCRRGDRVKILNPEVFIRCGYPFTKEMMKEKVTPEQKTAIHDMFGKFGIVTREDSFLTPSLKIASDSIYYEKVLDVVASVLLQQHGWGGNERKIFTEHQDDLNNICGTVEGKRCVKTGKYCHACGYSSYYSEYDYEPPYLDNEQTHVILSIRMDAPIYRTIEIEECHVEKLLEPFAIKL